MYVHGTDYGDMYIVHTLGTYVPHGSAPAGVFPPRLGAEWVGEV